MTSVNEIGVIPNERSLNRSLYFSGESDQVEGTSAGCNQAVMLVGNLLEAAMRNGRKPPGKVSLRSSAYEGDCSFLVRQFESTTRLFYIGHALLLRCRRVWCPRIDRGIAAEWTSNIPEPGRGQSATVSPQCPRSVHGFDRGLAEAVDSPRPQTCPQFVREMAADSTAT